MENIKSEFCICKYNKKDGTIEYRAKRKHGILKKIKTHKVISSVILLALCLAIIDLIYIWNFCNILINL